MSAERIYVTDIPRAAMEAVLGRFHLHVTDGCGPSRWFDETDGYGEVAHFFSLIGRYQELTGRRVGVRLAPKPPACHHQFSNERRAAGFPPGPFDRADKIYAIAEFGAPRQASILEKIAADKNEHIHPRYLALRGLWRISDPRSLDIFSKIIGGDEPMALRRLARRILERWAGGKTYGAAEVSAVLRKAQALPPPSLAGEEENSRALMDTTQPISWRAEILMEMPATGSALDLIEALSTMTAPNVAANASDVLLLRMIAAEKIEEYASTGRAAEAFETGRRLYLEGWECESKLPAYGPGMRGREICVDYRRDQPLPYFQALFSALLSLGKKSAGLGRPISTWGMDVVMGSTHFPLLAGGAPDEVVDALAKSQDTFLEESGSVRLMLDAMRSAIP